MSTLKLAEITNISLLGLGWLLGFINQLMSPPDEHVNPWAVDHWWNAIFCIRSTLGDTPKKHQPGFINLGLTLLNIKTTCMVRLYNCHLLGDLSVFVQRPKGKSATGGYPLILANLC